MVAVATALMITAVMALIGSVPTWSAYASSLLPHGARLLAPFSDTPEEKEGAIHVTHVMQRLVFAHVAVEVLRCISLGQAWLPPIAPPWRVVVR